MNSASNDMAQHEAQPEALKGRWAALAVLLCASFMNLLDVTIVNVALPSIQQGLKASDSAIEWIVAGYVLVFALGLLPFGRLGDIIGRRRIFLVGVTLFTIASGLCGLSHTTYLLVAARFFQGLSAAIMTPQVLALATVMFSAHERPRAFGMFGMTAGLATVLGPVIGGLLIDYNVFGLGWRAIFLINLPIGVFAVIAGRRLIPHAPRRAGMRNDYLGIVLVALAMFCLIFPLVEGRSFGWPLWCFAMMFAALPLLVIFILWQRRQARRDGPQLLSFSLMKSREFVAGAAMSVFFFSTIPGFFFCMALFLQVGFEFTPLHSGLTTVPFSIGVFIASFLGGRLGRIPSKLRVIGGTIVLAVGLFWVRNEVMKIGDVVPALQLAAPLFVSGFGLGVAIASIFQTILAGVPHQDAGAASGALQAVQQLGGAFGITISSGIFFLRIATMTADGSGPHLAYSDAFAQAIIYSLCAYGAVVLLALLLKGAPGNGTRKSGADMRKAAPQLH
ncbi:MFS transporter [Martelella sp. HB161492]|uniref:MFS transporter n=1 Tax=Martelella sp. HB161492 TaxID=2720726 RepID=UPI001FEF9162|nr:MFS transporter [Martelella sp. HB161492]